MKQYCREHPDREARHLHTRGVERITVCCACHILAGRHPSQFHDCHE